MALVARRPGFTPGAPDAMRGVCVVTAAVGDVGAHPKGGREDGAVCWPLVGVE